MCCPPRVVHRRFAPLTSVARSTIITGVLAKPRARCPRVKNAFPQRDSSYGRPCCGACGSDIAMMSVPQVSSSAGPMWASRACSIGWPGGGSPSSTTTAGVTRDRVTYLMWHTTGIFELVDTGGIGIRGHRQPDASRSKSRSRRPSNRPTSILFVVDTRTGIDAARPGSGPAAALRRQAGDLRGQQDRRSSDWTSQADEFYKLGRGKLICVSTHAKPRQARAAGRDSSPSCRRSDARQPPRQSRR